MTAELRSALIACHRVYALTLWTGGICTERYELWRREYLDAYRAWQHLEHPARRKAYRKKTA